MGISEQTLAEHSDQESRPPHALEKSSGLLSRPPLWRSLRTVVAFVFLLVGLLFTAALLGLVAVFTSAMIYIDTHRSLWRAAMAFPRFYGATFALGAVATTVVASWLALPAAVRVASAVTLAIHSIAFAWEMSRFSDALSDSDDPTHWSAQTLHQLLPWFVPIRGLLFIASSSLLFVTFSGAAPAFCATAAGVLILAAQTLERFGFFTTVIAPRMPRGI